LNGQREDYSGGTGKLIGLARDFLIGSGAAGLGRVLGDGVERLLTLCLLNALIVPSIMPRP
jgi:hypothetical protein